MLRHGAFHSQPNDLCASLFLTVALSSISDCRSCSLSLFFMSLCICRDIFRKSEPLSLSLCVFCLSLFLPVSLSLLLLLSVCVLSLPSLSDHFIFEQIGPTTRFRRGRFCTVLFELVRAMPRFGTRVTHYGGVSRRRTSFVRRVRCL